ncbi:MAG: hypothetical protein ABEH59_09800 [Halobacteriales archaeon]
MATATPIYEIPYTAANPEQNLGLNPVLTIENNAERDYELTVSLTHIGDDVSFFQRGRPVEGGSTEEFDGLMSKPGVYLTRFEFALGFSEEYEWPVDEDHGIGALATLSGETPTEPNSFFSIEKR